MDRTTEDPDKAPSYLVYEFERRAYPLTTGKFTIGRDATSDIIIREPAVSRSHAEVTPEAGEFMLRSMGATGTLLNGAPLVEPAKLEDGDTIGVGSMEFTFRRGRLPLGVSVVDTLSAEGHDPDAMTKRDTIKSPILGGGPAQPAKKKKASFPTALVLLVVLLAAAVWLFVSRR
jgi:pSer/pThr/pTyr-binding forkhead associated (FHA) protein